MSVGGFNQDAVAQAYLRAQAAMAGAQGPAPAAAQAAPAYAASAYANPYQPVAYQPVAYPHQAPAQAPASGLGDALGRLYRYLTGQGQGPAAQPAAANPYQPVANPYQPIANPYQQPFSPAAPPPPPPPPPPAPPAPAFQPAAPAYPALPQPWPQQPQAWPQQALPQPWPQQPQAWPQQPQAWPQQPQAWPQQPVAQPAPALPGAWQLPSNWPGQPQAAQPQAPLPQAPAPVAPAAAPAAQAGSVTVQKGDTLMKIAARVYGDESAWTRLFEANRDQIRNPNLIHAGMVLRVPGAQGDRPAAPGRPALQAQGLDAAPAAPASGLGARAVAEARRLMASGYKYPPNLTTRYFHRRFEVGCCADFVVDAWAKAGVDVFKRISNPHYTPTQRKWLQDQGAWAPKNASVKVGDWVFFKWPGTDASVSHVAMVSEVDAQGRPTKIIESYSGNKPVRERAVGSSSKYIVGFGRLDVIAAKGN